MKILKAMTRVGLLILAGTPGVVSTASADIAISSLSADVSVTGAAGLTFDPTYQQYSLGDSTTMLGSAVSISGSAVSGPTTASSMCSIATTSRTDGFAAHMESAASAHGPNGAAIGEPTLRVNFTLTDAGPLWIGGLSSVGGGDVEIILEGPLSRLFYSLDFSGGPIDFYAPLLEAGDYGFLCRAPSHYEDDGSHGGGSFASTDFIVATVPAPGLGAVALAGLPLMRRRRG